MPDLYFVTSPAETSSAAKWGHPLAHMAYGTDRDTLVLTVGALSLTVRSGWMVLTDHRLPDHGSIPAFAAQVRQECRTRRYEAIMFDFEQPANDRAFEIIEAVSASSLPFLVPQIYADAFPQAMIMVDSAISGGNLKEHLVELQTRWPNQLCLSLHPLQMRFPLPSNQTVGEIIDAETLKQALKDHTSYFSHDLGCRYFTQQINGQFFFTLFDDADSLRYKLSLADELGIKTAVGLYQELLPFLPI